jgi:hypothetical protein
LAFALTDDLILQFVAGPVNLGPVTDFEAAMSEVRRVTGGSSGRGRWSFVFGLTPHSTTVPVPPGRLAAEAADLRAELGGFLSEETKRFLDRLAEIDADNES